MGGYTERLSTCCGTAVESFFISRRRNRIARHRWQQLDHETIEVLVERRPGEPINYRAYGGIVPMAHVTTPYRCRRSFQPQPRV
jgi:hypothetical protein